MMKSENREAKRQQNIEDNRRFLAALKINDIREEIKANNDGKTISSNGRRVAKKEIQPDLIRRSSRIRKIVEQNENLPPIEEKRTKKKTDENRTYAAPKVKLELSKHMLIRCQSTSKKVALYNTKAKLGDDDENSLL